MTTFADVKRLTSALIKRNADLALAGRYIVTHPVHHVMTAVLVDRVGSPEGFQVFWVCNCLFIPEPFLHLGYGQIIFPDAGCQWDIGRPNIIAELTNRVEAAGLPEIRAVNSLQDFYEMSEFSGKERVRRLTLVPFDHICVEIARGQLETAKRIHAKTVARMSNDSRERREPANLIIANIIGPMLVADDRTGLAALLRQWEAANVKKFKLQKFWQPSPFPLESATGA